MNKEITTIPQHETLKVRVSELRRDALELEIKEQKDLLAAADILHSIKEVKTMITARKEEITRPQMQALASTRDLFRPLEEAYIQAEKLVKSKVSAFEPEVKAEGSVGSVHTRTLTKVRIIDEKKIPRSYLTPDMAKITKAVVQDGKKIAGVEMYEENIVVSR